jgi:predicted SAM-dependent methyltransferase/SAM-dependent methyltransferase
MSAITSVITHPGRNTDPDHKDFSYASGERQTATEFGEIRLDHASRYQLAVQIVKEHFQSATAPLRGLDLFCGNGYGSWLAAKETGAHMLGIDGSADAVAIANRHYSTASTIFSAKCFPFALPAAAYDFILCFESIEHVGDPDALFIELTKSLKPGGVLFVSTPNEATIPFALNAQWFQHHVRHFREQDLIELARRHSDVRFVGQFGQKVYRVQGGRVVGVGKTADMMPTDQCHDAHCLIQLFVKPEAAPVAAPAQRESGCDTFTPGVINPDMVNVSDLRLDVGCGEAGPQPGHVGVDIRPLPGVGILSSTWGIDALLRPECVSAFYSRHTLEHVTFPQAKRTFASWFRLLKPGGRVHILVPDLAFHIAQFLDPNKNAPSPVNPKLTQRQHAIAGFYGWQREADHRLWDVHKCGYTEEIMGEMLAAAGFVRYQRLPNQPWHLDIEAYKSE